MIPRDLYYEVPVSSITMWWDRLRREWVLYPVDAEGNQLAEADYARNRAEALITKERLEAEYLGGNQ